MKTTVVLEADEVRALICDYLRTMGLRRAGGTGVKLADDIKFTVEADSYHVLGVVCTVSPDERPRRTLGDMERLGQ